MSTCQKKIKRLKKIYKRIMKVPKLIVMIVKSWMMKYRSLNSLWLRTMMTQMKTRIKKAQILILRRKRVFHEEALMIALGLVLTLL